MVNPLSDGARQRNTEGCDLARRRRRGRWYEAAGLRDQPRRPQLGAVDCGVLRGTRRAAAARGRGGGASGGAGDGGTAAAWQGVAKGEGNRSWGTVGGHPGVFAALGG